MKRTLILSTALLLTLPAARADELDCFPMCAAKPVVVEKTVEKAPAEQPAEKAKEAVVEKAAAEPASAAPTETTEPIVISAKKCNSELVAKVDELNDRIKPVKDLIGYVHSPQSLALKVVNDHIVKIPSWVGFALDPVGTVKNKAIDMARDKARELAGIKKDDASCKVQAEPAEEMMPDAA